MEIFLALQFRVLYPLLIITILGWFLQISGWFQESFGNDSLSKLIMNVAMPVAILPSVLKYLTLDKLISFVWWFVVYLYRLHSWFT